MSEFTIHRGFEPEQSEHVARLYWTAFASKLTKLMGPDDKGISFFTSVVDPEFALTAIGAGGEVLGVAGFKTSEGGLAGGDLRDLAKVYGWVGAIWRGLLLSVLERDLADNSLLMDGICVSETARGQGVGTALLAAIKEEACARGLQDVRLDVIDTNPRARALYERQGFTAGETQYLGPLRYIFGFRSSVAMRYAVPAKEIRRDAAN
ncbi:GNAT family N-acetyltransferase [uncultured Shimia sp.]|uniref:GNAT family N-acetyltransferase n=1 Tax=uncultured Shimia sp. TaxID=573152 RepID=UPI00260FD69A|nr:GNAT family N-acetyltransferase [uncultured Shimia sp.]